MRRIALWWATALLLAGAATAPAEDWPQWRGPERTGISKETGLLKSWPADGPKLLWAIDTPGKGFAAPSIVGETIYLTGTDGDRGVLYALGLDGKIKWEQVYGKEWTANYPMSRTTPTIDGGKAYVYSGQGWAACFDAASGEKLWALDTLKEFRGQNIRWGIAENPLIVDELFICHPGGSDAAVVALDKATGKAVWTTKGFGEKSAYCSPIRVTIGATDQIVTQTEENVVGVASKTGEVLWKVPQKNRYSVHANTPLVFDSMVYVSCGYGWGSQLIKVSADGRSAAQIWRERKLDNHHEGVLRIDGRIYGSSSRGKFCCLDPKDGRIVYEVPEVNKASIVYADGRIYAYDEKGGVVSLVEVSPTAGKVHGQFKVAKGSGPHWTHPVVANGVLYLRHGEAFLAYSVKAD
ncbi:MAG TPA: PQQ-binding-like beta-propeller repeat protein [Phycisphaerae bacterium]|nr:PQQ-binding-like beta-propeller repeat protein [Phycisphaerae bacterium]